MASRRPGDGTRSAHADDADEWSLVKPGGGANGDDDFDTDDDDDDAKGGDGDEESRGARPSRTSRFIRRSTSVSTAVRLQRSAAVEARLAAGGGKAGLERASAVWERMSSLMSRKLIIGLLAVIVIYPFLEVVRADLAPLLFLHMLERAPFRGADFNATLASFLAFDASIGGDDYAGRNIRHRVIYVGACDVPPATPLGALPADACDGAFTTLLAAGAWGSANPTFGLRAAEVNRVVSDSGNSAVWFDIREEQVLEAKFNVGLTVGIVGLLLIWAYAFAKDAHRLLINVRAQCACARVGQ